MLAAIDREHLLRSREAEGSHRDCWNGCATARNSIITHVTLADAYASDGRIDDALRELHWLTEHRGRAYLELNSFQILQARNVAESDLASLRMAELEAFRQHVDAAKAAAGDLSRRVAARQTARVDRGAHPGRARRAGAYASRLNTSCEDWPSIASRNLLRLCLNCSLLASCLGDMQPPHWTSAGAPSECSADFGSLENAERN